MNELARFSVSIPAGQGLAGMPTHRLPDILKYREQDLLVYLQPVSMPGDKARSRRAAARSRYV